MLQPLLDVWIPVRNMRITCFSFITGVYCEGRERGKEKGEEKRRAFSWIKLWWKNLAWLTFQGQKNDSDFRQQCLFHVLFSIFLLNKGKWRTVYVFPPLSVSSGFFFQHTVRYQVSECVLQHWVKHWIKIPNIWYLRTTNQLGRSFSAAVASIHVVLKDVLPK